MRHINPATKQITSINLLICRQISSNQSLHLLVEINSQMSYTPVSVDYRKHHVVYFWYQNELRVRIGRED